ncbi:hypothetical protein MGH68_12090 [Erysipelothrix sp. D19-032]
MNNEARMTIEFKNGGASLKGNMNIKLLNEFVVTISNSYGHDRFFQALNETTNFEDCKYEVTATFEDGETLIDFEPPLKKEHYLGICNVVLQAQGVMKNDKTNNQASCEIGN